MSDSQDTRTIEVSERVAKRFERERKETKNAHVPAMDECTFLKHLLDTRHAVQNGYYNESVVERLRRVVSDAF